MDGHFRAFSFVDRITEVQAGTYIRGHYTIPNSVEVFPASLVAEAVGQLAAWAAMAEVEFSCRPVAGIAGMVELLAPVRPGQVLDLSAQLESVDTEAVGYGGIAHVDGAPVLRLANCLGPMLPLEEFDDPQCLRDRYALLRTTGATPGAFAGLPALFLENRERKSADVAQATLKVPELAPFFADHFPRRPVFPGTLLMHANLDLAGRLVSELRPGPWVPRALSAVKLRSFISPAETLELEARPTTCSETELNLKLESRIGKRLVCSAQIRFVPEHRS